MLKTNENEQETGQVKFAGTYPLRKPVQFEGQEITELVYDLEEMTGKDVQQCRQFASTKRGRQADPALLQDDLALAMLFVRSAKLPFEFLDEMKAADFAACAQAAQAFFAQALSGMIE